VRSGGRIGACVALSSRLSIAESWRGGYRCFVVLQQGKEMSKTSKTSFDFHFECALLSFLFFLRKWFIRE
jgi:hypothetical protein